MGFNSGFKGLNFNVLHKIANWTVLKKPDGNFSSVTGKTAACFYTYTRRSPLVSRISSSRFLICEKSCTMASDRSSRRLSSTSRGFSFAASPSYIKHKQLYTDHDAMCLAFKGQVILPWNNTCSELNEEGTAAICIEFYCVWPVKCFNTLRTGDADLRF